MPNDFPIGPNTYTDFGDLVNPPGGTTGITSMSTHAIPVQDLTRMLQNRRIKRTQYDVSEAPGSSSQLDWAWDDASAFDEVRVNGIIVATDSALPQPADDRIIVTISLAVTSTLSNWVSSQLFQRLGSSGRESLLMTWGTQVTGHASLIPNSPQLLPQYLMRGENAASLEMVVSGAGANHRLSMQMVSAPPGVLAPYFGV